MFKKKQLSVLSALNCPSVINCIGELFSYLCEKLPSILFNYRDRP